MSEAKFSNRILRRFVETAAVELGTDQFGAMLALSGLSAEWAKPEALPKMDAVESAKTYAALQAAMRTYYGRGARGSSCAWANACGISFWQTPHSEAKPRQL